MLKLTNLSGFGSIKPSFLPTEWTYLGSIGGSVSNGSGANNVSLASLNLQKGDIVFVAQAADNSSFTMDDPDDGSSDYDFLLRDEDGFPDANLHYKQMGNSPDTSVNINAPSSGTNMAYLITAMRGAPFSDPFSIGDLFNVSSFDNGGSGDPNPGSITTTIDRQAVLFWGFLDDDDITSCTNADADDVAFQAAGSGGDASASVMFGWYEQATAGSSNPAAFTTDGDDDWKTYTLGAIFNVGQ